MSRLNVLTRRAELPSSLKRTQVDQVLDGLLEDKTFKAGFIGKVAEPVSG